MSFRDNGNPWPFRRRLNTNKKPAKRLVLKFFIIFTKIMLTFVPDFDTILAYVIMPIFGNSSKVIIASVIQVCNRKWAKDINCAGRFALGGRA